ncbi:DUF1844 domain-containing protein [bacterium]|nr:DUF1844 domain-containing protein [bacterium]
MGDAKEEKLFEMLFLQMVMSLNEAAMIQMGKTVNPATGKIEKNVVQAQGTIDLLRMLKKKTAVNLNDQEQQLLDKSIMNLEMDFVQEKEIRIKEQRSAGLPQDEVKRDMQAGETTVNVDEDFSDNDDGSDPNDTLGNRPGMNN